MKEKLDSSSPTGILEDYFRSSGSESTSSGEPKPPAFWHGIFKLLRSKSSKPVSKLHPLSVLKLSKRLSNSMRESLHLHFRFDSNVGSFNSPWKNFTLRDLQAATNYFSHGPCTQYIHFFTFCVEPMRIFFRTICEWILFPFCV